MPDYVMGYYATSTTGDPSSVESISYSSRSSDDGYGYEVSTPAALSLAFSNCSKELNDRLIS